MFLVYGKTLSSIVFTCVFASRCSVLCVCLVSVRVCVTCVCVCVDMIVCVCIDCVRVLQCLVTLHLPTYTHIK